MPMSLAQVVALVGAEEVKADAWARILAEGPAVVPTLLAVMEDELLWSQTGPGAGWASIHAAELLGEMKAPEAVEPMMRILDVTDWQTRLHDRVLTALSKLGGAALEPLLRAIATAEDEQDRASFVSLLSELGVKDERIFQLLIASLADETDFAAADLAAYGDARALPHLVRALDAWQLEVGGTFLSNQAVIELANAIRALGGSLSAPQEQKLEQVLVSRAPAKQMN